MADCIFCDGAGIVYAPNDTTGRQCKACDGSGRWEQPEGAEKKQAAK